MDNSEELEHLKSNITQLQASQIYDQAQIASLQVVALRVLDPTGAKASTEQSAASFLKQITIREVEHRLSALADHDPDLAIKLREILKSRISTQNESP